MYIRGIFTYRIVFTINTRDEFCYHHNTFWILGQKVDSHSTVYPREKVEIQRDFLNQTCCFGIMFGKLAPQHSVGLPYLLPPILTHCSMKVKNFAKENILTIILPTFVFIDRTSSFNTPFSVESVRKLIGIFSMSLCLGLVTWTSAIFTRVDFIH